MSDDQPTTEQHAANAVREFFKDPKVAEAVVNSVVKRKPTTWSRRSNAPYYNEHYATQLKHVADEMLRTREDQVFFYKVFEKISHNTLYIRINQSIRYLVENLDTGDVYHKWSEMISVTRERNVGVILALKEQYRSTPSVEFRPKPVLPVKDIPVWQRQIEDFLEDPRQTKLHIDKLCLTPEQMKEINASFVGVTGVLKVIRAHEIKLVKME